MASAALCRLLIFFAGCCCGSSVVDEVESTASKGRFSDAVLVEGAGAGTGGAEMTASFE